MEEENPNYFLLQSLEIMEGPELAALYVTKFLETPPRLGVYDINNRKKVIAKLLSALRLEMGYTGRDAGSCVECCASV